MGQLTLNHLEDWSRASDLEGRVDDECYKFFWNLTSVKVKESREPCSSSHVYCFPILEYEPYLTLL